MKEQLAIIQALGVRSEFDALSEIRTRIEFLKAYLVQGGQRAYVLGISGGVDSLTAGLLAQRAVQELRESGHSATFIAVRLPYGVQADEHDAAAAVAAIRPDRVITVDIKPAADSLMDAILAGGVDPAPRHHFILGNVKARQRMVAQYAIAGASSGLVIGTDHAAEALMGFYTKFGDGAADILPLAGLNKRRVRAVASKLGAPEQLVWKTPTADLESDAPLRPDEDAYGVTYDQIDDFLEGRTVASAAAERILSTYRASAHKRALPVVPTDHHQVLHATTA
ncbi:MULTISPECIES: ammonia-dependent NAD(+) synthetase [unclassified Ensifer]|uniref:ammonia-dependent NAD(+) synthetase n=1 Tax=unclassified Ensifer TaxID=2633371 RepID=UPI00070C49E4|nr:MULTISPECIES: ammonia-dependent NAD(+) synthetase [unclassified Ensifer]KRD68179.1 NAD(+) synthetase [Ensifer sp. Root278]MBV7521200.1 ammonia-dependent NAD(+) synthetase [Ensifer sp. ENS12]